MRSPVRANEELAFTIYVITITEDLTGRSRPTISVRGGAIKLQPRYIARRDRGFYLRRRRRCLLPIVIPLFRTKRSVNVALGLTRVHGPRPHFLPSRAQYTRRAIPLLYHRCDADVAFSWQNELKPSKILRPRVLTRVSLKNRLLNREKWSLDCRA